ncbi:hypothetical protein N0V82_009444 [Gnomoniopsis sp. IMI 355080]|nr:hypothetical protein N0V82_009444 [Gnomoniopsis sp. IMI 355080]
MHLDRIRKRVPSGAATRARRIRRARRELDDAEDILVMEYMAKRDLGSWLERLTRENSGKDASQRIRPPEKVLWSIFQCLWRGCIAMAWPEAQAVAILIGDFDDEHFFPILKISDFGHARVPKWDLLGRTPEQTSEAWDFVPNMDGLRNSAIAGNYGSASNVFHIGLIMWQLVTTWEPEVPFVPRPYAVRILEREASGWTYGHALLDQYEQGWSCPEGEGGGGGSGVWPSETLRNTIAHCMDYIPRRRMNLTRLGNTIRQMLEEEPWEQTDEECKQWAKQLFADAPTQPEAVG